MAEKVCNSCKTDNAPVPFVTFEAEQTRAERREKRLVWLIALLIVLLVGSNVGWLIYESQFEALETTVEEYAIEQNAESGNNNSIINGGEIVNGEADDKVQENNN